MRSRQLRQEPDRTFLLRLEKGDPFTATVEGYAAEHDIRVARLQGIGAVLDAEVGFYDLHRKEYDRIALDHEMEVLSVIGNVTRASGQPRVHAHVTLGRRDGSAVGGHLFDMHAAATLEVFLLEVPGEVERVMDEGIGLALMDL